MKRFNTDVIKELMSKPHKIAHYLKRARVNKEETKCYSRSVAVVVVDPVSGVVLSEGRNGPPSGAPHPETWHPEGKKECPRRALGYKSGEGLHVCSCAHAEQNAIAFAARKGIPLEGTALIQDAEVWPRIQCATVIMHAGIEAVILPSDAIEYEANVYPDAYRVSQLFEKCGIMVFYFDEKKESVTCFIDYPVKKRRRE